MPKGSITTTAILDHMMAWLRPGAESLSEPTMVVRLLTHICIALLGLNEVKVDIAWHIFKMLQLTNGKCSEMGSVLNS